MENKKTGLKTSAAAKVFFDKVIFPEQFKNNLYKTIFHIVNSCSLCEPEKILKVCYNLKQDVNKDIIKEVYDKVVEKYDSSLKQTTKPNCFTHLSTIIQPEDLVYTHGNKRYITIKELKFIIFRIVNLIFASENKEVLLTNGYFLNTSAKKETKKNVSFADSYFKYTGKKLDSHKLAHILQILHKFKYLYITYNTKSQRIVKIGSCNPYYIFKQIPDITEEQDIISKNDRVIEQLKSENAMLRQLKFENDILKDKVSKIETNYNNICNHTDTDIVGCFVNYKVNNRTYKLSMN